MKNIKLFIYTIIIVIISCIGSYINYSCNNSCKSVVLEPAIVQEKKEYVKLERHYEFIYRKIKTGELDNIEVGQFDYARTNPGDTIYIK